MIKAAATLKSLQFRQTNLTDCYGRLSFGPVNPGQGLTIGNALRRILLNDLPGIGVIGAEINGVQSEFSTLPGIRESVIEIFLNLRELIFAPTGTSAKILKPTKPFTFAKLKSDLTIETFPYLVTAGDLDIPDYHIVDPNQPIATLLSQAAAENFKLTIFICKNQKFFKKINNFDHIHLNHENLFWILKLIRIYNNKIKITMSIRTILERNFFSKIQINVINNEANKKLFITKKNFYEFNYQVNKKKMNNFILENFDLNKQPQNIFLKKKNKSRNLNILSISNFSHDRGVDRIVRIAEKLDIKGFRNIKFNILGDYKINSLKNILKNNSNQNLKYFVQQKQLKNVNILGHKSNTQKYFKKNHLLLYLPRNDSAWGRNIIEALNNGLPVITLGKTNSLIINKKNGFFFYNFKETLIIKIIKEFYYNRNKLTKMSIAAKNISKKKNDKKKISKKLNLFFNY